MWQLVQFLGQHTMQGRNYHDALEALASPLFLGVPVSFRMTKTRGGSRGVSYTFLRCFFTQDYHSSVQGNAEVRETELAAIIKLQIPINAQSIMGVASQKWAWPWQNFLRLRADRFLPPLLQILVTPLQWSLSTLSMISSDK